MKSLEDMLKESQEGSVKAQDLFAEQYNKVMNMLDKDYGIRSVHLTFIVRDILDRVYSGEKIVEIDRKKMIQYKTHNEIPEDDSDCFIIPLGCYKERLAKYFLLEDLFRDGRLKEYPRSCVQAWRYQEKGEF